jgi:hypothetical protein
MPLQQGANVLRFYLSSGAAPVEASIYLWSHKSKVFFVFCFFTSPRRRSRGVHLPLEPPEQFVF